MWLYNPSDPHSTPMGADGLFGDRIAEFNVNVPPYWRLKYRLNSETLPGQVPYDVLLAFDYGNSESSSPKDSWYRWVTAYDGERNDSLWAGFVPLIESVDDCDFEKVLLHYTVLGNLHDYRDWRLFATGEGWFLSEKNPDEYGTGNDAVYSLEHRELGGPADNVIGADLHCHFDGLGENKFIYKYDRFPGALGSEEHVVYPWRPDIIIEPYWP